MSKRNKLPTWAMWIIFILCGSLLFAAVANIDNIKDKIDEWREDDTEESETNKKDDTDPSDISGTTEPVKYTLSGVWKFNETIDFPMNADYGVDINFVSNGTSFNGISTYASSGTISYGRGTGEDASAIDGCVEGSLNDGYGTIDFGTEPQEVPADFYVWFTANAVKQ